MTLTIAAAIHYRFAEPTDFLLQIEPAVIPEQRVEGWFECTPTEHFARVFAQDGIGERIWLRHRGEFQASWNGTVAMPNEEPTTTVPACIFQIAEPGGVTPVYP